MKVSGKSFVEELNLYIYTFYRCIDHSTNTHFADVDYKQTCYKIPAIYYEIKRYLICG